MTTKHTPAPWALINDCEVRAGVDQWPTGDRNLIARVEHTEDEMGYANARLIAAAPEMLEALEALIERARQWPETFAVEVERAEKAVRKARGET